MLIVILDVGCLSASLFVSLFVCFLACLVLTQTSREMDLFGLEETLQRRNPAGFGETMGGAATATRQQLRGPASATPFAKATKTTKTAKTTRTTMQPSDRHLTGAAVGGAELNSDHPAYSGLLNHTQQKARAKPHSAKVPSDLDSSFFLVAD